MGTKNGMFMLQPATRWQDAIPCGNGSIGALVYGHIKSEIITLNHENLWLRRKKPELKTVNRHLSKVRKLLMEGRYAEAEEYFTDKIQESYKQYGKEQYQPLCDLKIDHNMQTVFTNYRRSLDFETGLSAVYWEEDKRFVLRELFVSSQDNSVVLRISGSDKYLADCSFCMLPHDFESSRGMGSAKGVSKRKLPFEYKVSSEDNWIEYTAKYPNNFEFGGVTKIIPDGDLYVNGQTLKAVDNKEILLITKLFVGEESRQAVKRLRDEINKMESDYDVLLNNHVKLHREMFNRIRFKLDINESDCFANEKLLLDSYQGNVKTSLIKKMFDFGRYLLISCSRPGGMPANLQGIWNGDYNPAWSSDYHNDINIQMNYWLALPSNLTEVTQPFFDYYESMLEDYRENARKIYGCRGIMAPVAQTTHGLIYPGLWVGWTAGAGWIAQLFYDYYLYTGDRKFLKERTIPFLKEVALFYEDFLIETNDKKLMFAPSLSPENRPSVKNSSLVTINATMDIAVCREVLSNLCSAYDVLGINDEGVKKWKNILKRLPEYQINSEGALKEWIHPELSDNYQHRHNSHIYPLFPGCEITEENNKRLYNAARVAVDKRIEAGYISHTGWSYANMANIYARLGDGDKALECLELICRSCVGKNLFTYHNDWRSQGLTMFWGHGSQPPFQIDANLGFSAAVIEMLVNSVPGMIKLLPALPKKWTKGTVEGLKCRGGITVTIIWDMYHKSVVAKLFSDTDQKINVKLPFVSGPERNKYMDINLVSKKWITIQSKG